MSAVPLQEIIIALEIANDLIRKAVGINYLRGEQLLKAIRTYGIAPPEGMALVPIEPTLEMFNAAEETGLHAYTGTFVLEPVSVYKAMLAAAPKQENSNE